MRSACSAPHLSSGHEVSAVAGSMFLFDLTRRSIPVGQMQISRVIPIDPRRQDKVQFQETRPLTEPEEFFLQRPHEPFRVSVPFRVVVTRKCLRDPERRARLHKGDRRRLTPVIAHQRQPLAPYRELLLHRLLQRQEPMRALSLQPGIVADNLLRVPIQERLADLIVLTNRPHQFALEAIPPYWINHSLLSSDGPCLRGEQHKQFFDEHRHIFLYGSSVLSLWTTCRAD